MRRYYQSKVETRTLAIGIKGDLSSLCGAIKRFQRRGKQWNGLLTLKEQCARRIARMKNEQLKCFINAYLPPTLFKYVTKDIFNLRRPELTSNYAKPLDLCEDCKINTGEESGITCRCPNLEAAIHKLNKYFVKRINKGNKTKTNQLKEFELMYTMPDDEDGYWNYEGERISFFLYLSPCEEGHSLDTKIIYDIDFPDYISNQSYRLINGQASVEEKLLFVDVMRYFGGFEIDHEQAQLISYYCCDIRH